MRYDDQPVRVFRRFWRCPLCDNGHTAFTGTALMCNPPKYLHRCLQCGGEFSAEAVTGAIMYEYEEAPNDSNQSKESP
jgi:hypothetical protein